MARYTQAQYEALRDVVATGALSVTHDGETVQFRSAAEMWALLGQMETELGIRTRSDARPARATGGPECWTGGDDG